MTTAFEVEEDLSWDQVKSSSRTYDSRGQGPRAHPLTKAAAHDKAEEYRFLRQYGYTKHQIAARLGYNDWAAFSLEMARAGIAIDSTTSAERRHQQILDRLIESGEPFSSEMLPIGADDTLNMQLIQRADRSKRIVRVGSVRMRSGATIALWQRNNSIGDTK